MAVCRNCYITRPSFKNLDCVGKNVVLRFKKVIYLLNHFGVDNIFFDGRGFSNISIGKYIYTHLKPKACGLSLDIP